MRRTTLAICAAVTLANGVAITACGSPHGNATDLLVVTPDASGHRDASQDARPLTNCLPISPSSDSTPSDLNFSGPCAFGVREAVQCVNRTDDYYAYVNRRLPDGAQLSGLVNVEKYRGPGTYTKNSVVFLQVARQGTLYEWRQQSATLTVKDAGSTVLVATGTELTPLAGNPARGIETVEGTLTCQT